MDNLGHGKWAMVNHNPKKSVSVTDSVTLINVCSWLANVGCSGSVCSGEINIICASEHPFAIQLT